MYHHALRVGVVGVLAFVAGVGKAQAPTVRRDLGFSYITPPGYHDARGDLTRKQLRTTPKPGQAEPYIPLALVRNFAPRHYAAISLAVMATRGTDTLFYLPTDKTLLRGKPGRVLDKERFSLNGVSGVRFTVQTVGRAGPIMRRCIYLVRRGRVCIFLFTASQNEYKSTVADFDQMMASLRWLPTAKPAANVVPASAKTD